MGYHCWEELRCARAMVPVSVRLIRYLHHSSLADIPFGNADRPVQAATFGRLIS
jgi:hypothetical protein